MNARRLRKLLGFGTARRPTWDLANFLLVACCYQEPPSRCVMSVSSQAQPRCVSKGVLYPELHLAHGAGGSDFTERRRGLRVAARRIPVRMVREIERLESKLQRVTLVNPGVLDDRKIPLPCARLEQHVPPHVAE